MSRRIAFFGSSLVSAYQTARIGAAARARVPAAHTYAARARQVAAILGAAS